jgi:hypothetical protein
LEILKRNDETTTAFIKNSAFLLEVLSKLEIKELKEVLKVGRVGLLNSLGVNNLLTLFSKLNDDGKTTLLTDKDNGVLTFLLQKSPVKLADMIFSLKAGNLNEVLKAGGSGFLDSLNLGLGQGGSNLAAKLLALNVKDLVFCSRAKAMES